MPFLVSTIGETNCEAQFAVKNAKLPQVNFISDGLRFSPEEYVQKLQEINKHAPIQADVYGSGGATKHLEEAFAKLTGKEKAIFMPSGTMANQLAIKLLNGQNTKAIVPENSHIFRDEADAAQAVHGQRLIPVGNGKPFFEQQDLEATLGYLDKGEVFKSGLGTIGIESPVRRADGVAVPFDTIKKISTFCRGKGYKLHLDGARLHLASAFTGVSIAQYASCFDTVYISLYKYLNASSGAILCGNADVVEKMAHQIKIHGGTTYQTWSASAMALHYLDGIEQRWKSVVQNADYLVSAFNEIKGLKISSIVNGTNIFELALADSLDSNALALALREQNIWVRKANKKRIIKLQFNESLLRRTPADLVDAWMKSANAARK